MRIRALEQELAAKETSAEMRQRYLNAPVHEADVVNKLFKITPESSELALDNLLHEGPPPSRRADIRIGLDLDSLAREAERDQAPAPEPEPPRKPLTTVTAHNLKIALPPGKLPRALASGLSCPACTAIGAPEELALTETYVKARETLRLLACPACASIFGLRQVP